MANHESSSERRKQNRASSWARAQVNKQRNAAANAARAAANKATRAAGGLTPHQLQRAKRREARDQLRLAGLLPPIGVDRVTWERNGKINVGGKS